MSIQKDFPMPWISHEGKRRINFRVDALNIFNHPVFYWNSRGNTPFGFGTFPTEFNGNECIPVGATITTGSPLSACSGAANQRTSAISEAENTAWATFNGRPLLTTQAGRDLLRDIRNTVDSLRLTPRPGQTSGALPDNFFSVQVPQGFATTNPLTYDITTAQGLALFRLRQVYEANFGTLTSGQVGNSFGSPNPGTSPRYLQFGIRLIF